jgi:5-methylthioadenosine/S-adenosylhomocysteine deaminase
MQKTKVDKIIINGFVLTMNDNKDVFRTGAIVIQDNLIVAVGDQDKILQEYIGDFFDAEQKIVMPGFVNTHTHLPMSIFRGIANDITLFEWLNNYIFPMEKNLVNKESVKIGAMLSMAELIRSGITCFNDMYYFQDITAQAAIEAGIRGIVAEGLIDDAVANSSTVEQGFEYAEFLLNKYKNNDLIDVAVASHAPYSCSDRNMQKTKQLAQKYNANYHLHLSETKWEFDKFMKEYKQTPVQYVDNLGLLDEKTIAAHCVWLTDKDIEIIANKRVGVAHNPECNMKISSGVAPIPKLLQRNAKVGLGTDGAASNNNQNMIQELHTMALLHKLDTMNPTVLDAYQAVNIATNGGAKVLGLDRKIGSLEAGKFADIIFIDFSFVNALPSYNPYSTIVYALLGNEVSDVIINGKFVMKNNNILTFDEQYAKQQVVDYQKVIRRYFNNKKIK